MFSGPPKSQSLFHIKSSLLKQCEISFPDYTLFDIHIITWLLTTNRVLDLLHCLLIPLNYLWVFLGYVLNGLKKYPISYYEASAVFSSSSPPHPSPFSQFLVICAVMPWKLSKLFCWKASKLRFPKGSNMDPLLILLLNLLCSLLAPKISYYNLHSPEPLSLMYFTYYFCIRLSVSFRHVGNSFHFYNLSYYKSCAMVEVWVIVLSWRAICAIDGVKYLELPTFPERKEVPPPCLSYLSSVISVSFSFPLKISSEQRRLLLKKIFSKLLA